MASISGHRPQGQEHCRLSERNSRRPVSAKSANNDRVESPPLDRDSSLWDMGTPGVDFSSCHSPHSTSSPVYVSDSRASNTADRCSVTRLAGAVDVHVSTVPLNQQSHSETTIYPGWRDYSSSPLVAVTTVVPTPTSSESRSPSHHSIPPRRTVTTGVCLGRQVVPSAWMEACMQHYQAAGFSEVASRLTAAPRRPSTNSMYDNRWLIFAHWAVGQGIDPLGRTAAQIATFLYSLFHTRGLSPQIIKGYRTCLASVFNCRVKAAVVQHKTISDMIASMDRPRITPVLPQWDIGIVRKALSKPLYELLREASLKRLTLKQSSS